MSEPDAAYAFGDSAPASERLALVARIFAPSTRSLLARLPARSGSRRKQRNQTALRGVSSTKNPGR